MTEPANAAIQIAGLAEVVLNIHDLAASLRFYRDILGLPVISPPERTNPVFLRAGAAMGELPAMIVLVQMPPDAAPFVPPRTLHHLALAVPTETFAAARAALTAHGFAVRDGIHPVIPSHTLYIDDPDGNEVELIAPA